MIKDSKQFVALLSLIRSYGSFVCDFLFCGACKYSLSMRPETCRNLPTHFEGDALLLLGEKNITILDTKPLSLDLVLLIQNHT